MKLKHFVFALGAVIGFWSTVQAQLSEPYMGIGAALYDVEDTFVDDHYWTLAGFLQGGVSVADTIELRASVDVALFHILLAADALYRVPLEDRLELYLGLGPDLERRVSLAIEPPEYVFGLHATAGLEYRFDYGVGIFAEARPRVLSSFRMRSPVIDVRSGINLHF